MRDADAVITEVDGNHVGHGGECGNTVQPIVPTPIMLQKMHKNGTTPDGPAVQILDRTTEDGPLIEAPDISRSKEGVYFLFYSSGCTRSPSYVSAAARTSSHVLVKSPLTQNSRTSNTPPPKPWQDPTSGRPDRS